VPPSAGSFLSRTKVRSAAARATSRWAGSSSVARPAASSTHGFSNSPSRNFAVRTRRTASSSASSVTSPCSTACGSRLNAGSIMHISMSIPAARERAPASARSLAKCCVSSERTALASDTTKPSKPRAPRSTSVSSQRFAEAGTPFRSI